MGIRKREVLSIKKIFPYYEVQFFLKLCELEREKNKYLEICDIIIEIYDGVHLGNKGKIKK